MSPVAHTNVLIFIDMTRTPFLVLIAFTTEAVNGYVTAVKQIFIV